MALANNSIIINLDSVYGADRAFLNCVRADPAHDWLGDKRSKNIFKLTSIYKTLKKKFLENDAFKSLTSFFKGKKKVTPNLVLSRADSFYRGAGVPPASINPTLAGVGAHKRSTTVVNPKSSGGGGGPERRERRSASASHPYKKADFVRKSGELNKEPGSTNFSHVKFQEAQAQDDTGVSDEDVDMLRMILREKLESGYSTFFRIQNNTWIGRRSFGAIAKHGNMKADPDFIIYFDIDRAIAAATGDNKVVYDPGWLVVNDEVISPFDVEYCGVMKRSEISNAFGQCGGAKTQHGGSLPDNYYKFKITNGSYKGGVISLYDNRNGLVFVPPPPPTPIRVDQVEIGVDETTGETVITQSDPYRSFNVPYDQNTDTFVFTLDSLSIYRANIGDAQVNQSIQIIDGLSYEQLTNSHVFFNIVMTKPYGLYMYLCLFTGLLDIPMVQYLTAADADFSVYPPQLFGNLPIENEYAVLFPTLCTTLGLLNAKIGDNFEQLLLNELRSWFVFGGGGQAHIDILYNYAFVPCYAQNPPDNSSSAFLSGLAMFYSVRVTEPLLKSQFTALQHTAPLIYKLAITIASLGEEQEEEDENDLEGFQSVAEPQWHPGQAEEPQASFGQASFGQASFGQASSQWTGPGGGSSDDPYTDMKVAYLVLLLVSSINYAQKDLPDLQADLFDGSGTDSVSLSDVIGSKLAVSDDYSNPDLAGNQSALNRLVTQGPFTDTSKGALEKNMVKAVCLALSGGASSLRQPNTQLTWSGDKHTPPSATEEDLFLDGGPKEKTPSRPGQVAPQLLPTNQYRLFDIVPGINQVLQENKRFMITNAWSKPDETGLKTVNKSDFFIDNKFYTMKEDGKKVPMFFCPTSSVMDPQSTCSTLDNALQSGYEYGIQDVTVQSDNQGSANIKMRTRMETLPYPSQGISGQVAVSFYLKVGNHVLSNYASTSAKSSDWPNPEASPSHPPLINDITQVAQTVKGRGEAKRQSIFKKIDTSSPMDAQTAFYFLMKFVDVVNIYPYSIDGVIIQNGQPPFTHEGKGSAQRASLGALCWLVKTKPDKFRLKINTQSIMNKGYDQTGGRFAHWFTNLDSTENQYIFTVGDLRRGIVEYGLRKFLGDYCQTLTSVASNGGYLQRNTDNSVGQSILSPNSGRLGLHNDQPATAVALLLTMLGKGGVNPNTVNGSYFGGVKKNVNKKRPFVKYVLASRWSELTSTPTPTSTLTPIPTSVPTPLSVPTSTTGGKSRKHKKKTRRVQKKQKKRYTRNKNDKNKARKKTRRSCRSLPKPKKTRRRRASKAK